MTLPGSRTVGSLQTYANWTDQNLAGHSSSHFPFILDTQPQHQHPLGQYQLHEVRDREWTAAQRASREYDRGFLREGWQRRWESCSPAQYNNRDAPSKRNDSSYRELEAWAARYSHSLPRRRRIEAEMRGTSQSFADSSRTMERDYRSGTDPRLAALQQVIHSNANAKETGLWTKAGRQLGSIHHPSQTLAADTGHMLHLKDHSSSQRRVFSQPPGYVAPPPYGSPQKSLPKLQREISGEMDVRQQSYGTRNTAKKQDATENYGKEEKENLTKLDCNQNTLPKIEGLKHLRKETETLQESTTQQEPNIQFEGMLSLQLPQLLYSTSNQSEELSPKVIEGRKFRLNKKKGGLTIFCLVSRIADTSENLSSQTYNLQTTLKGTEKDSTTGQSTCLDQTHKLADEVDFTVPTLRRQSGASTGISTMSQQETAGECFETITHVRKEQEINTDCTIETQVTHSEQSSSVKYPLWKEPSFLIKSETEASSTCSTGENEEGETDILHCEAVSTEVALNDTKGEILELEKVSEFEDCKCTPVVDTSCVVVKMELISSPKKEHVHYFDSIAQPEHSPPDIQMTLSAECVQSNSHLNQDLRNDRSAETEVIYNAEWPESELKLDPKQLLEDENEISTPCVSSFSVPEKESLEGRAQRILGIPVDDCFPEQQPDDDTLPLVKDETAEPLQAHDITSGDKENEILTEAIVEEESKVQLDDTQAEDAVHFVESEHDLKEAEDDSAEVLARHQEQLPSVHEQNNNDLQCDISMNLLPETPEDLSFEIERKIPPLENKATAVQLSQGPSSSTMSSSLLLPSLDAESPAGDISPSKFGSEKELDPGLMAHNTPQNPTFDHSPPSEAASQQLALPPTTCGTLQADVQDSSASAHTSHSPEVLSPVQSNLDFINENTETSTIKDQAEKGQSLHMSNSEITDDHNGFPKGETGEAASQQNFDKIVNGHSTKETDVAIEEGAKDSDESQSNQMTEAMLEMSQESTTKANILHPQHECVNEQQGFCVEEGSLNDQQEVEENSAEQIETSHTGKQVLPQLQILPQSSDSHVSKDQQPQRVKSAAGTVEQFTSPEDTESEVNMLNEQHTNDQENKAYAVETCITEDHPKNGASKDSPTQLEEPISKENAADSHSHEELEDLHNTELEPVSIPTPSLPLDTDVLLSEFLSPDTNTETTSKESVNGVGPPAVITETVPWQHLEYTEEALKFPFSPSSDLSPSVLPLPSGECEGVGSEPINCLLWEQPQYPKSLWDAVSRIRKHTAPDSENEEEEVSEPWDPESAGEDATCSTSAQDMHFRWRGVVEEQGGRTQEEGVDSEDLGDVQHFLCDAGLLEHGGPEDSVSYSSSTSSRASEDTVVIGADEEKVEDMPSNCASAIATHEDTKKEQCCPSEVKNENAVDAEGECTDQSHELD